MDVKKFKAERQWIRNQLSNVADFWLKNGWDHEHGMKLWWPHNEALIASMMIYRDTRDEKYLDIFYQILDYCKKYFADEYGEWYGYLRRDGNPTLPACKGSTFKGPFHVPRCLILVDQMMTEILGE